MICAAIVEHLRQEDSLLVAHHFLSSSSDHQNDIMTVLRSWIAQMISTEDRLLDTAQEEVREAPSGAGRSTLWKLFTVLVRDYGDWTFVLDGLDEVGFLHDPKSRDPREDRAKFLRDLQDAVRGTRTRVLVVSRDEPDIRLCLSAKDASTSGINLYEHHISIADVEQDVLAFSTDVVESRLKRKSKSDKAEISEMMSLNCD